jgi:hypothetical protein
VFAWGSIQYAAQPTLVYPTEIVIPDSTITNIIAGQRALYFMTADGSVFSLGVNDVGQLADGTKISRITPVLAATNTNKRVQAIVCQNLGTAYFVYPDEVHVWGFLDQTGFNDLPRNKTLKKMDMNFFPTRAKQVVGGVGYTIILLEDGTLYSTGRNDVGQLGDTTVQYSNYPGKVYSDGDLYKKKAVRLFPSWQSTMILADDGNLYGWGTIRCTTAEFAASTTPARVPFYKPVRNVVFTGNVYYIFGQDRKIYACQNNTIAELELEYEEPILEFYGTQYGFYAVTEKNIVLISDLNWIGFFTRLRFFKQFDTPAGVLDFSKYSSSYTHKDVHHILQWIGDGVYMNLVVIFKNGETYQNTDGVITKMNYIVDTNVTTVEDKYAWLTTNGTVYSVGLFEQKNGLQEYSLKGTKLTKVLDLTNSFRGATAILASCTAQFVGDNCDIPVCFDKNATDSKSCNGRGICKNPDQCECSPGYAGKVCQTRICPYEMWYNGENCDVPTTQFKVMIILVCSLAFFVVILLIGAMTACTIRYRHVVAKQNKAELEMKNMLEESLIRADQLAESVDRDWVIPFSDISFIERLAEGAFGVVMKGRYQNVDV